MGLLPRADVGGERRAGIRSLKRPLVEDGQGLRDSLLDGLFFVRADATYDGSHLLLEAVHLDEQICEISRRHSQELFAQIGRRPHFFSVFVPCRSLIELSHKDSEVFGVFEPLLLRIVGVSSWWERLSLLNDGGVASGVPAIPWRGVVATPSVGLVRCIADPTISQSVAAAVVESIGYEVPFLLEDV